MDKKVPLISYTLAAMSGVCFLGGVCTAFFYAVSVNNHRHRQFNWKLNN